MPITVIDAMNGMGQDWECSEVLRAEVRRLRGLLAAAEQRATDAEERAERLAAAVRDLWPKVPDYKTRDLSAATFGVVNQEFSPFALTAPAPQPDERAAAERELLDRLTKRILAEIVYCAPDNRQLAEKVARVAKVETDLILARHDDTDGAEKEAT